MFVLFVLFSFFSQFNSLIKIASSGAPFAWGMAFIAILAYCSVRNKNCGYMDKRTAVLLFVVLLVLVWFPYSILNDLPEYIIRVFQFVSVFSVYFYSKNNFFLKDNPETLLKYFFLLQAPSLIFGMMEVFYIFTDNGFIGELLYEIRVLTVPGRENVVHMKTVVFHFFEHSMSISYILMLISLLVVWVRYKLANDCFYKNICTYKASFKYGGGYFLIGLLFVCVIIFSALHRSGSYFVILMGTFFYVLMVASVKVRVLVVILVSILMYVLANSPIIAIKLKFLLSGGVLESDFFRLSTIFSSFGNFINNPWGSGAGSFSKEYFYGVTKFIDYFGLQSLLNDAVYGNSMIMSKQGVDPARATTSSLYAGLISELGILFVGFIFIFHRSIFTVPSSAVKIIEFAIVVNLFLGYPMAYPQLWIALGMLHGVNERAPMCFSTINRSFFSQLYLRRK